jgi:hypothetical protein
MPNSPKGSISSITSKLIEAPKAKQLIRVKSLDADDCIFNGQYVEYYVSKKYKLQSDVPLFDDETNPLFITNKDFFDRVKQECSENQYKKLILMVGSLRQDESIDLDNSLTLDESSDLDNSLTLDESVDLDNSPPDKYLKSESFFSALTTIKDKLSREIETKCIVDKFLISDLCSDEKYGTNFDRAIANRHLINTDHSSHKNLAIFDSDKFLQSYAQIHKIASENSEDFIIFDFYDDKPGILSGLLEIFSDYPDLLPKNVIFNLDRYAGKFTNFSSKNKPIQGAGEIDFNYVKNIRVLMQLAFGKETELPLAEYIGTESRVIMLMCQKPGGFDNFLKARQLNKPTPESVETHVKSTLPETIKVASDSEVMITVTPSSSGLFKSTTTSVAVAAAEQQISLINLSVGQRE